MDSKTARDLWLVKNVVEQKQNLVIFQGIDWRLLNNEKE